MPMTYTIDHDVGLVRIVGSGRLTDEEMLGCVTALRADPTLEPDMNTLSDMRGIEAALTPQGVEAVVQLMLSTRDRRSGAKAAIVADSDLAFGMARMLEMRSEDEADPTFSVFRHMADARAWLDSE